jgi:hypothetical protein
MTDRQDEADKTRKERSPSFPFIALKKAVERLKEMADAHKRNQARLVTVATTWGYAAKSSGLLQTAAALKAYGLIEEIGSGADRKIQISDLGWRILHDARPGARDTAIRDAAAKPRLISEYLNSWVPERPSDAHCLSELQLDRGFNDVAARLFLKVFDETVSYANLKNSDSLSPSFEEETTVENSAMDSPLGETIRRMAPPASTASGPEAEPFRMSIGPKRLWGTFDLTRVEQADEMIDRLNALKGFLGRNDEADDGLTVTERARKRGMGE